LRVLTSATSLCDVVVRESESNGLAFALEANGQLMQASNVYLADNDAAGLFLDGGARATAGSIIGVVRNNALGVTRTNFLPSDCPRWDLTGLSFRANAGGDIGPCP
jgi:hypothetical protein